MCIKDSGQEDVGRGNATACTGCFALFGIWRMQSVSECLFNFAELTQSVAVALLNALWTRDILNLLHSDNSL
jgi:hypothetical protein